jgi:hypothetical protein
MFKLTVSAVKMSSSIRQNFTERTEALLNKQIHMELHASYVYMAMVRKLFYFG